MGSKRVSTSGRSKDLPPRLRARVEQSRKRFRCDLLGFWRQCMRPGCRQRHRCLGDPQDCFRRHHDAMPGGHNHPHVAAFLSKITGISTVEQELRAAGLSGRRLRPERSNVPPPRQADRAASSAVPAQESEASRQARREAELLAKVEPEHITTPEMDPHERGMTLEVDESQEIEWSPMTGSAEEPVRAAGLPPPPDSRSARASPARPMKAVLARRPALRESSPGKPGVMTKDACTCRIPRPSRNDPEA